MEKHIDLATWRVIANKIEKEVKHLPFYVDHWDSFETLSLVNEWGYSCLQSAKQLGKQFVFKKQVEDQIQVFSQSCIALPVRGDLVQNIQITLESADLVEPKIELRSRSGHLIESQDGTAAKFAATLLPCRFARFDELEIRVLAKGDPVPIVISVDMTVYYLNDNGGIYSYPIIVNDTTMVKGGIFGGLGRVDQGMQPLPEKEAVDAIITGKFPPKFSN